jgi:hypothetical protein
MPFADLLQWVSQSRKTGTLAVDGDPFSKKVYFRSGAVVAASSENPKEFLGYYLVGWNHIGEDELLELLDMQDRHGTLLGELLVIVGHVSREELNYILQTKTEEAIYDLFLWEQGDFRFLENILPAKKFQPLNLAVDVIIMEGVRRRDEIGPMLEKIENGRWIPRLVRAVDVQQMGPTELAILREINGSNSIEEIALTCRIAEFHVLSFVYHGVVNGLFEVLPPKTKETPIPGYSQSAWRALLNKAQNAIGKGDLGGAQCLLTDIRTQYADTPGVVEQVGALELKLADKLTELPFDKGSVLELAIPLAELTKVSCSPEEGFLLSRVNGTYTVAEILKMIPGTDVEKMLMVDALMQRDILRVKGTKAIRRSKRDLRAG